MPYTLPTSAVIDPRKTGGMGLNLRAGPARSGARLATMRDNTRVAVVGAARENFDPNSKVLWYQVRTLQFMGFCSADFIALDPEPIVPLPTTGSVDAQRTGGVGLNMRASPDRTANRLVTMPANAPLQVIGAAREGFAPNAALWYLVQFGAQRGYCLSDFVAAASTSPILTTQPGGPFVGVWPSVFPQHVVTAPFNQPRPSFRAPIKAHEGIDLRAPNGTPVVAWADGRVVMTFTWDGVTRSGDHAYGNHVKLFHPALGLFSIYCHLQSFNVSKDQVVQMGEQLGRADNTGNSEGAHLHFMLIDPANGLKGYVYPNVIDPTPYLPKPYTVL
ncbi:MAG TPA: peptidoglycan DD-metalloendopeptidase family protein [Anaerolineae bacterium]|nr:peptidoglycan DD-metalloendopeptidase family protein [Anaerolineae bacterium]